MQLLPATAVTVVAATLMVVLLSCATTAEAHNITKILAEHPEFSTFNHYLTVTHLAPEINSRETITVCAVDNAGMADLLAKHLSIYALKNVLSLHILLDYFGAKKLHQITNGTALAATMFQATGDAPGSAGFVNITDLKGGKVGFGPEDNGGNLPATFVKSVKEIPYNISVIHISKILPSPEAEAPTPSPSEMNLTGVMSAHGCKVFADELLATGSIKTFEDIVDAGLTVFCPLDDVFKKFLPKYKNLTAAGKVSLTLFHGIAVYESIPMLKSGNGPMNTLATDGGAKDYILTIQNDGEQVTVKSKIVTARITGTLIDKEPVAIYTIDKVLLPKELFNATKATTPAPAPAPEADSPKSADSSAPESDSPADAPDEDPADQTADNNDAGARFNGGGFVAVVLSVWLGLSL